MTTVDQQGMAPTSKVTAAGAGGAAGIVIVFIAGQFGVDVSPEVAAAITTLIALVAGYFKRESVPAVLDCL
jgi:enamine deaminase RidA (YjgF/YER057c/UK114 family)